MDGQTALHPFLLVFRHDVPFGIAVFVQIIGHVFKGKPSGLILLQRKLEKIPIVRLLQNAPARLEKLFILL